MEFPKKVEIDFEFETKEFIQNGFVKALEISDKKPGQCKIKITTLENIVLDLECH